MKTSFGLISISQWTSSCVCLWLCVRGWELIDGYDLGTALGPE